VEIVLRHGSKTTLKVIWYLRSFGTHTPSHPVPEVSTVIWYLCSSNTYAHLVPMFICHMCPSGTSILQTSDTKYSSKIWNTSRVKLGTWVFSRAMSTCRIVAQNSPIFHMWTSISGGMILQKIVKISN
jgi:hypothetical protein